MVKTMIRGKYILLKADLEGNSELIENGAVVQDSGTIIETGPYSELNAKYPGVKKIGTGEQFVIPGLINAHHHGRGIASGLLMGQTDGHLETWIHRGWGKRPLDPYLMSMGTLMQQIQSGTTTIMFNQTAGPVSQIQTEAAKTLQAFSEIGVRVAFSIAFRNQSFLVYGDTDSFLDSIDPELAGRARDKVNTTVIDFEEYWDFTKKLNDQYRENEKVKILLSPQAYHWVDEKTLGEIGDLSRNNNMGIHLHMVETMYQRLYSERINNETPVSRLNKLGMLGPKVSFAHGVWLTQDDLDLMAATGTSISHNPSSNLRLSSGIAPVTEMLKRKVVVGIGTDSAGINDNDDLLQEMGLALRLHRPPGHYNKSISADEILHMATIGGSKVTTFGESIGTLEAGTKADIVLIDWNRITRSYISEDLPPLEALVSRARKDDVQTVMIDGDVVYDNGLFTNIDRDKIYEEISLELSNPTPTTVFEDRDLANQLDPHIREYYANWKLESDQSYQFNGLN